MVVVVTMTPAHAQNVSWSQPVYAETWQNGAFASARIHPYVEFQNLPLELMQISDAGTPGLVLSGGAEFTDDDDWDAPVTPYLTKISSTDGHALWSWQPEATDPRFGRIWTMSADPAGNILVAGFNHQSGEDSRYLVGKFDAATGQPIWLTNADALGTGGYAVAADAAGDVFLTFSAAEDGQFVSKFDGTTGSLIWTAELPQGRADLDDFRLTVDARGDVAAGGFYCDCDNAMEQTWGTQVQKFSGIDGALLWSRRSSSPDFGIGLRSLQVFADGDVLVHGGVDRLARLAVADGQPIWIQPADGFEILYLLIVGNDRLFGAGFSWPDSAGTVVERIDATNGLALWRADSLSGTTSSATTLAFDTHSRLLVGWQTDSDFFNMGVSRLDADTGALDWSAQFGSTAPASRGGIPLGVAASPDGVFVGTYASDNGTGHTWIVYALANAYADQIFANGFELP